MGRSPQRRVALPENFRSRLKSVLSARHETLADFMDALSTGTRSQRQNVFVAGSRAMPGLLDEIKGYFSDELTWRYLMGESPIFDATIHEAHARRRAEEQRRAEVA